MTIQLPETIAAYIRATNNHDAAAFIDCFCESAVVNDEGREFRGIADIKDWSERNIFEARVTLDVLDVVARNGETVVMTKVDGNFDRTGLPDPVIIEHHFTLESDKIVGLKCRLVVGKPGSLNAKIQDARGNQVLGLSEARVRNIRRALAAGLCCPSEDDAPISYWCRSK